MSTSRALTRRRALGLASLPVLGLGLAACGGSGFEDGTASGGGSDAGGGDGLTLLIGSSGDAETKAVQDAAAAWSETSGTAVEVIPASDLNQQLAQGFASGSPADVFYLSTDAMAGYAANGSLAPYGDDVEDTGDYYPALLEAFTLEGHLYGLPKDVSTLALLINEELWEAAGLTEDDIPTTWDELADVARRAASDGVAGLTMSTEYQRIGAFMAAAGGELVTEGTATADSAENIEALEYVKSLVEDGALTFSADLGAGWGGEAFGAGSAVMVVEGSWITGAMANDYPDVEYRVVELPEGPAGKGTLQFTNAWGIAADSPRQEQAVELITFLTSAEQQMAFARAFGPMPSVQSVADDWAEEFPEQEAFLAGVEYAKNPPAQAGTAEVIADLNAQLETLASSDPAAILDSVQTNLEAALG
ncbi:MAG TPA: ABC transporter substrate-binding protein [Candidatus Brachybacterium intestinipullorum]|uniref:ABC transporter substrate-binding protein n=1 Tax=Candidatus Brachybacterium intestinipullorum TaxID=2838512 RepID=A0A9D2PYA4_9MICO|nr:ABC transporter substrate-binding protein [Candidatus Brachybacterium intestinipullorum]